MKNSSVFFKKLEKNIDIDNDVVIRQYNNNIESIIDIIEEKKKDIEHYKKQINYQNSIRNENKVILYKIKEKLCDKARELSKKIKGIKIISKNNGYYNSYTKYNVKKFENLFSFFTNDISFFENRIYIEFTNSFSFISFYFYTKINNTKVYFSKSEKYLEPFVLLSNLKKNPLIMGIVIKNYKNIFKKYKLSKDKDDKFSKLIEKEIIDKLMYFSQINIQYKISSIPNIPSLKFYITCM